MEGLKVMIELIDSSDNHYPLVYKIHKRFHISESLSKSYLCLLTLLFDNKEGESIKNKPYMDWNVVSVSLSIVHDIGRRVVYSHALDDGYGGADGVSVRLENRFLER